GTTKSTKHTKKDAIRQNQLALETLGFITVKFAPQREIPGSGKATTACSNAPRVDFFCGHHIGLVMVKPEGLLK
ncbi:MAG: hypothetical protein ABSE84_19710, partial [Isosphaeraceae bacterium]